MLSAEYTNTLYTNTLRQSLWSLANIGVSHSKWFWAFPLTRKLSISKSFLMCWMKCQMIDVRAHCRMHNHVVQNDRPIETRLRISQLQRWNGVFRMNCHRSHIDHNRFTLVFLFRTHIREEASASVIIVLAEGRRFHGCCCK